MSDKTIAELFQPARQFQLTNTQYRGRFAPSPSGPLHFGSLVAALGSYLRARSQDGLWFVRIEDIDKTREQDGATTQILNALEQFGLFWDQDNNTQNDLRSSDRRALVQSHRLARYESVLNALREAELVYPCQCTRKQIRAAGGLYQGTCRNVQIANEPEARTDDKTIQHAIRLKQTDCTTEFHDGLFGTTQCDPTFAAEDYIIKRRDGLFAYQLVVVIDDIDQGITEVVRGADILELTCRQLSLFKLLGVKAPDYLHLPLISASPGFKLSKQNHATAINADNPKPELIKAMQCLGLPTTSELQDFSVEQLILWGVSHWDIKNIPTQQEIILKA